MTVLSDDPPMMLVCLTRGSSAAETVTRRGAFTINVLREDHGPLAMRFAGRRQERFAGVATERTEDGLPMLTDALACLVCEVVESHSAGRHLAVFARVREAQGREGTPLAYYNGAFARLELTEDRTAYDAARAAALDGAFPLGTEFPLSLVAETLGLTEGAAFQAMRRLAREGLVERRGADRYAVTQSADDVISELCRARCNIEVGVLHSLSLPIDSAAIDELEKIDVQLRALQQDGRVADVAEWLRIDSLFHEALVALSDSPLLVRSFSSLSLPAWDVERLGDRTVAPLLLDDHRRLLDALRGADSQVAAHAIREHSCRLQKTHHHTNGEMA